MNNATQIAQEFRARHDYSVGRPSGDAAVQDKAMGECGRRDA
ncbi:hypothetical protein [Mesorhizobium australicum]